VELFFRVDDGGNPGGKDPNWFYYWKQIKPGVTTPVAGDGNQAGVQFGVLTGSPHDGAWKWLGYKDGKDQGSRIKIKRFFSKKVSAFDLIALHAAVLPAPAVVGGLADLKLLGDLADAQPRGQVGLGVSEFANYLSRRVLLSLHESLLWQKYTTETLSQHLDHILGSTPRRCALDTSGQRGMV
jgi:hypothetical protein